MIYNFKKSLEERLSNRKVWLNYYSICIKHQFISEITKKEYYKDKKFLKIFLSLYYLPINIYKFFSKLFIIHEYEKTKKEIEVIKKTIEDESESI